MQYLIIAILLSVLISSIFKMFDRYRIDTFQAIVANYIVCVIAGVVFIGQNPFNAVSVNAAWFPWSLLMGCGFIGVFTMLAFGIKINGMTTTTIANKLSLVIPVLFSVWLYKDQMGIGKVAGILLAFPAIWLTTRTKSENRTQHGFLLPALIFLGGGMIDTQMKYVQMYFLPTPADQATYTLFCFAVAGAIGVVAVIILLALNKTKLKGRNILAGIAIGVPNYFSIYYLIRMLNSNFLQSSAAIPVFNIGIVVISSVTAIVLFREKAGWPRLLGLFLSILSIALIALGDR